MAFLDLYKKHSFAQVIDLPKDYEILDFSQNVLKSTKNYSIGKFDEHRPYLYTAELFAQQRNIHMGIDIGCPVGTPVFSFWQAKVYCKDYHSAQGDYGYTLILEYQISNLSLWVLYGHLAKKGWDQLEPGQSIEKRQNFCFVGDENENGGWPPHLHFQVSKKKPSTCDMPGAVSKSQYQDVIKDYLDPRSILGPVY